MLQAHVATPCFYTALHLASTVPGDADVARTIIDSYFHPQQWKNGSTKCAPRRSVKASLDWPPFFLFDQGSERSQGGDLSNRFRRKERLKGHKRPGVRT